MRRLIPLAGALAIAVTAGAVWPRPAEHPIRTERANAAGLAPLAAPSAALNPSARTGHVEERTFWSASLRRTMPYRIYLPASYGDGARLYPVLYLLHGMGGSDRQWQDLGIATVADRLIGDGTIAPLIIVMPEGERAYWVDHAVDGPKWGRYTATDVVSEIDATFRTIPRRQSRAIGGLSMGAHGALQLALNHPDEFAAVGAHSLPLRRFGSAPSYFGAAADFAKRDPLQLVQERGAKGCPFAIWIDIGDADPWATGARLLDGELSRLGVTHEWHEWPGDHSGRYWSAHLADYLRFYDATLSRRAPVRSLF